MPSNNTITSANSTLFISVGTLYPTPVQIQGFAADNMFATEDVTPTEVVMGVDGNMSLGFTHVPRKLKIQIMPDSPSLQIFEDWQDYMLTSGEIIVSQASVTLPSIGRQYTCTKGALTKARSFPDAKKTLQPIEFEITFQSVIGSNI